MLARSADQVCDVGLRQSNGDQHVSVGKRPSVPFGESENPARDAGFDLERGQRLDLFVGRTQTRRERASQVAGERWDRRQAVTKSIAIHPEQGRLFERQDTGRAVRLIERAHLADGLARAEDRDAHIRAVFLFDVNFDRATEDEVDHFARLLNRHQRLSGGESFPVQ